MYYSVSSMDKLGTAQLKTCHTPSETEPLSCQASHLAFVCARRSADVIAASLTHALYEARASQAKP